MDPAKDIREFLTSRRAKITPDDAGLPVYGTNRRVTGLRREEVAMLAGISVEYYTRLERGNANGVSEDVLEGVARALQLDEAERAHLFDLVRTVSTTRPPRRRPSQERVRTTVQQILDSMTGIAAYVRNGRLDILAANQLGRALYADVLDGPVQPPNTARFLFLDPRAPDFFVDWDAVAHDAVAILRAEAGRDPHDRRLSDLIGELATRSEEFRVRWAAHNVKFHRSGTKRLHHPSSETSRSPTKRSTFPPTAVNGCSSTAPSPALRHTTRCSSSPAGRRRRPPPPATSTTTTTDLPAAHRRTRLPEEMAMPDQPSAAQQMIGDFAPKLVELTDDVLFGDVWERPGLSKRDRSLITVAALVALNRTEQLPGHLRRAIDNGVTRTSSSKRSPTSRSTPAGPPP